MTKCRPRSLLTAYSIYGAEAFVSTVCMEMILWSLPRLQIAILIFGKSFLISVIVYEPLTWMTGFALRKKTSLDSRADILFGNEYMQKG